MHRLDRKIALVTGAARGIGAGIARAFAAEGARVWITDIDDAAGEQLARELGPQHRYAHLDVGEEAQWQAVIAALLAEAGRLDILVNNAGITGLDDASGAH